MSRLTIERSPSGTVTYHLRPDSGPAFDPTVEPESSEDFEVAVGVQYWYDSQTRLWVVYRETAEGYEVRAASFESSRADAEQEAERLLADLAGGVFYGRS